MPDSAIGITILAGTVTLADGTDTGGICVDDILPQGTRIADIVPLARSNTVAVFDRGNARKRVAFSIDRTFTDLLTARQAQFAIFDVITGATDLTMVFSDGVTTVTILLAGAVWTPLEPTYHGVSTLTKFVCEGAAFSIAATGNPFSFLAGGGLSQYQGAALNANGTTTVAPDDTAGHISYLTEQITVGAGSGAFTNKIVLGLLGRTNGDRLLLQVAMASSANPTVEIRNATTGGTLLDTVAKDTAVARIYDYCFVYNGTAWVLYGVTEELA